MPVPPGREGVPPSDVMPTRAGRPRSRESGFQVSFWLIPHAQQEELGLEETDR
ncbi:MAG: hypothetical protein LBB55_05585 [Zoogloeaceae bacterium]|nr:hypothetical protein [Zoogloeaceae bacterium]